MDALPLLDDSIISCVRCPRLVAHRENMARIKRRAYRDQAYWGRPVPSFGPADAQLLIVGLAPGAHGANRTGRVFTGDKSGDILFRVLHTTGFASRPTSISANDGLALLDARITCAVHCAPPDNKPAPAEIANCSDWLSREFHLLPDVRVIVALGKLAFDAVLRLLKQTKSAHPFGHGATYQAGPVTVIASYHPSQQNTSTGRLTEAMLLAVFVQARALTPRASGYLAPGLVNPASKKSTDT